MIRCDIVCHISCACKATKERANGMRLVGAQYHAHLQQQQPQRQLQCGVSMWLVDWMRHAAQSFGRVVRGYGAFSRPPVARAKRRRFLAWTPPEGEVPPDFAGVADPHSPCGTKYGKILSGIGRRKSRARSRSSACLLRDNTRMCARLCDILLWNTSSSM